MSDEAIVSFRNVLSKVLGWISIESPPFIFGLVELPGLISRLNIWLEPK